MTDTRTSHSAGASSLTITKDCSGQSDSSADSPLAARVHALHAVLDRLRNRAVGSVHGSTGDAWDARFEIERDIQAIRAALADYYDAATDLEAALAAAIVARCCCEIDRHDFNCPIHNDSGPSRRGPNGDE